MTPLTKSLQSLDSLVKTITSYTGLDAEEISSQLSAAKIPSFQFDNQILVSPEDCGFIIDTWASRIKASLRVAHVPEAPSVIASTSQPKANFKIKDEPIKENPPSPGYGSLSWPEGYEKVVNHQYGPSLKKILPQDSDQRRVYLEAIAQETEAGSALAKELAVVIAQKYGGPGTLSEEKAMLGIIKKAAVMLKDI